MLKEVLQAKGKGEKPEFQIGGKKGRELDMVNMWVNIKYYMLFFLKSIRSQLLVQSKSNTYTFRVYNIHRNKIPNSTTDSKRINRIILF